MKINNKTNTLLSSVNLNSDRIILDAEVTTITEIVGGVSFDIEVAKINSPYKPQQIFWYYSKDLLAVVDTPTVTSKDGIYKKPASLVKINNSEDNKLIATYIPAEETRTERVLSQLNIDMPLNPNANIQEWVNLLNLKIERANRNLSIWDTYNIYKVAYNMEDLSGAIASLPLSSSVLINLDSPSTRIGSWIVKKGDFIVKDYVGVLHHVPGSNGGFYFPSSIDEVRTESAASIDEDSTTEAPSSGVFQINFQYSNETPQDGTYIVTDEQVSNTPYKNMHLHFPVLDSLTSTTCYSYSGVLNAESRLKKENGDDLYWTFFQNNEKEIYPIIYYYLEQDGLEERVYLPSDYKLNPGNDQEFYIENPTKFSLTYEVR